MICRDKSTLDPLGDARAELRQGALAQECPGQFVYTALLGIRCERQRLVNVRWLYQACTYSMPSI